MTGEPLSLDAVAARVRDPRAGAVVTFQGTTRDVDALHYEAYAEMAEERIAAIVAEAIERHGLCAAAAEHRDGRGAAVGAERGGGRLLAPPRRGLRGRARDHRPREGRGADLEEGGRGWRGALGRGHATLSSSGACGLCRRWRRSPRSSVAGAPPSMLRR
ncbi:MAG: molybdenum cofactor biosynthesis protein MoaE [Thermoleophilaceae bacterium]